jgi:hypothetical protein
MAAGQGKPKFQAFTLTSNAGCLQDLKTPCRISAAFDPATTPPGSQPAAINFVAIWDTGASACVVTQKVVDACQLQPYTMKKMQGAYGGFADRPAYLINLHLPNGVELPNITATWGEFAGPDMLIGMDIITKGDFAITHEMGKTIFSFRIPSLHTIDYVRQANQQRDAALGKHGAPKGGQGGQVNPHNRRK